MPEVLLTLVFHQVLETQQLTSASTVVPIGALTVELGKWRDYEAIGMLTRGNKGAHFKAPNAVRSVTPTTPVQMTEVRLIPKMQ